MPATLTTRRPTRGSARLWPVLVVGAVVLGVLVGFVDESWGRIALLAVAGAGVVVLVWLRPRFAFLLLGLVLLFQGWIAGAFGRGTPLGEAVSRSDDVLVVLLFVVILGHRVLTEGRIRAPFLLPALGFVAAGFVSAALGIGVGTPQFIDAYLSLKLYVVFLTAVNLDWGGWEERLLKWLNAIGMVVLVVAVVEFLAPELVHGLLALPPVQRIRLGLAPAQALFVHPGVLGWFLAYCAAFAFARYLARPSASGLWRAGALAVGSLLSLRVKPILGLLAAAAVGALLAPRGHRMRGLVSVALIVIIAFAVLGGTLTDVVSMQLRAYVSDSGASATARSLLYLTSFSIARDRFPLGTGLASFGTWPSRIYYSPVYEAYGLSSVWGLSKAAPDFIMDTFWPAVLGEAGVLGVVFFAWLLVGMTLPAVRLSRRPGLETAQLAIAIGTVMVFAEAFVESLGSPVFFQQPSVYFLALPAAICWQLWTAKPPTSSESVAE